MSIYSPNIKYRSTTEDIQQKHVWSSDRLVLEYLIPIDALPDELLEHVLLQLSSWPVYLFRAAATCKRWRRVVTGFHTCRNVLAGHYLAVQPPERTLNMLCSFEPWPHRPAAHIRDHLLSLDSLPGPSYSWRQVTDSRHGLLAVVQEKYCVVVCNPWTKQYKTLNLTNWTPPGDYGVGGGDFSISVLGTFLLDEPGLNVSNFTVVCARVVRDYYTDAVTAQARKISVCDNSLVSCYDNEIDCRDDVGHLDMHEDFLGRQGGSIFWSLAFGDVLAVDEATGELWTFNLPNSCGGNRRSLQVAAMRILSIVGDGMLHVFTLPANGAACVLEKRVGLSSLLADIGGGCWTCWQFADTQSSSLEALELLAVSPTSRRIMFSLDVDTMKLTRTENKGRTDQAVWLVFPYELPCCRTPW